MRWMMAFFWILIRQIFSMGQEQRAKEITAKK